MSKRPREPGDREESIREEPIHDAGAYDERPRREERAEVTPQSLSLQALRTAVVTYSGSNSTAASGSASILVRQLSELEAQLSHAGKRLADITAITLT